MAGVGYKQLAAACGQGERPLCRPGTWQQEETTRARQLKKEVWHRLVDSVLFVPATPESKLVEQIDKVLKEDTSRLGFTIIVVDAGGISISRKLVKTDLLVGEPCLPLQSRQGRKSVAPERCIPTVAGCAPSSVHWGE